MSTGYLANAAATIARTSNEAAPACKQECRPEFKAMGIYGKNTDIDRIRITARKART